MTTLEKRAASKPTEAHMMQINDQETLTRANDFLLGLKVLRQEIANTFDSLIKDARESLKGIQAKKKEHEDPVIEAERIIKNTLAVYIREKEKERQKLLQEEADRQRKLNAAIDKEKIRLEKEKKEAAEKALKEGDWDKLKEITEKETPAADVNEVAKDADIKREEIRADSPPALDGVSLKQSWKAEVINPDLVTARFKTIIDKVALNAYARAMKEKAKEPGVRFYPVDSVAARKSS